MPHATTPCCRFSTLLGDHHDNEFLIGPGKALDPEKYFVIATDFLGNAKLRQDLTTGPTNSGLKMHFPRITARDWVNADYKLVKEYLGIDHVVAAVGGSIGGINAFQLAVSHPDFVSAIIPIAASPQTNPQARMVLRHVRDVIALDPGWYSGMYDVNPVTGLKVALMELVPWLQSPQSYMDALTTSDKLRNYQIFWEHLWSGLDARDVYYQLDGWSEFNVGDTPGFNGDVKAGRIAYVELGPTLQLVKMSTCIQARPPVLPGRLIISELFRCRQIIHVLRCRHPTEPILSVRA